MEGAKALGEALRNNNVLEEINVSNNRMSAEGAVLLAKGNEHWTRFVSFTYVMFSNVVWT